MTFDTKLREGMEWTFERLNNCVMCGKDHLRVIYRGEPGGIPLQFEQCADCSFIFQNPRMTVESIGRYFNSQTIIQDSETNDNALGEQLGYFDYFSWEHSYKRTAALRLRRLSRYRPPPASLLEIGSASGWFLESARERGYVVRGLDVSQTFATIAKRRYGLDIDVGWIEEFPLPTGTYDVVCMFGGISCWRDLMTGLTNVRQTLAPDGVFCFNYPNYHSVLAKLMGRRYPEFNHASLSILHRDSMHKSLARAGFKVMTDHTEWQIASLGRMATYLKIGTAVKFIDLCRLGGIEIPVWAVGTRCAVATPA
jgi:SAM-dependent methyltransferase